MQSAKKLTLKHLSGNSATQKGYFLSFWSFFLKEGYLGFIFLMNRNLLIVLEGKNGHKSAVIGSNYFFDALTIFVGINFRIFFLR